MNVTDKTKKIIFWLWLFIVPAGLWLVYQIYPPHFNGNAIDLIAFLILAIIVSSMPIIINQIPLFFIQWVSLAVFLIYGLFIELILMQIAIISLLIRLRVPRNGLFRFPMNSLMFFLISLVCGIGYYTLGGDHDYSHMISSKHFWILFLYQLTYFWLNQFALVIVHKKVYGIKERKFFTKDFVWEGMTSIIMFPIGLVLYLLYNDFGMIAALFVGVPFISLSIILTLYHSSDKINRSLQKATEIGHQLAGRLKEDEVIDLFMQRIGTMIPADYAYILDVVNDKELHLIRGVELGIEMEAKLLPIKKNEGISGLVWGTGKPFLFNSQKEWARLAMGYYPSNVESVLCMPIVRSSNVVGVLFIASNQKRAYEKSQLMIFDILCSYFAVAIENARHYEETKHNSERCALTKLYNYRYFENLLNDEFTKLRANEVEELSLIILDIDHFKSVNDTYGHQSGNEILCQLAERLQRLVGKKGTVARYGGEEFVILFPGMTKQTAVQFAEVVRQTIANRPFTLQDDLQSNGRKLLVNITASIGVASAPKDADEPLALIRHADRAMYIGAKQAGRNRVAEYAKA